MTIAKFTSILNTFSSLIIILLISLFYIACYHFGYNFFYQDDYHLLRYVTLTQDNSLGISEKLKALWDLHNEHRIVFPRLLVLADFYIQRHIDWQVLNTVAALYYFGIFIFLYLIIKKIALPIWYAVPIALLIFQPSSHENFYWTISILQQVGNIFWAMFLFYSLIYFRPKYFWISIIIAIILTFTHGNGLFALGVAGILLFIQKRHKELLIWMLLILLISITYFWGYHTAQNSNITGSLSKPIQLMSCFGSFWGNFIKDLIRNSHKIKIAILGGIFIFSSLAILNFKFLYHIFLNHTNLKISKEKLFVFGVFAFFLITSALVALSRSWSSIEAGFQNRYLHNSVITFTLLYISILSLKSKKITKITGIIFLVLGMVYNIFSWYSSFEFIKLHKKIQESDAINYQLNGITTVNEKSFNRNISSMLKQSFDSGVSIFPESLLTKTIKNLDKIKTNTTLNLPIDIQKDSLLIFDINNSSYSRIYHLQNYTLPIKAEVFLVFKSNKNIFVWATSHRRNSKKNFLATGKFFTDGFFSTVKTDAMPDNEYAIGILQKNNNQFIYYPTKYKISNQ